MKKECEKDIEKVNRLLHKLETAIRQMGIEIYDITNRFNTYEKNNNMTNESINDFITSFDARLCVLEHKLGNRTLKIDDIMKDSEVKIGK